MDEHEEPDLEALFGVPDEVRKGLKLGYLRPYALRCLWQLLVDADTPPRLRLEAAKLVVERTKDSSSSEEVDGQGVAQEVEALVEALRRRG